MLTTHSTFDDVIPVSAEDLAGFDLTEIETKVIESKRAALERKKSLLTPQAVEEEEEEEEGEEEEEKTNEKSEESEAIHTGVKCDGCGTLPITGNRYKCHEYVNFMIETNILT